MTKKKTETNEKKEKSPEEKRLDAYRRSMGRHVLVVEAEISEDDKRRIFSMSDHQRIAGNEVRSILLGRLKSMEDTKRYRGMKKSYKKACEAGDEEKKKEIGRDMSAMQKQYGLTKGDAEFLMKEANRFGIHSAVAQSYADRIWGSFEMVLYGKADMIHFKKKGDLPELKAKQYNRGIVISCKDDRLCARIGDIDLNLKYDPNDTFVKEETAAICEYLKNGKELDHERAIVHHLKGKTIDSFRPCYAAINCKVIRGKLRVFVHITVEGKPKEKKKAHKPNVFRHHEGKGKVGGDIGPQTLAYHSDVHTDLVNIGQRGNRDVKKTQKHIQKLQRSMERSLRASNPENYRPDGTIRKGKKVWKKSRHYRKMKAHLKDIQRKEAASRRYAINELVNDLRSMGNVFVTEPSNIEAMRKKSKSAPERQDKESIITKKDGSEQKIRKFKRKRPGHGRTMSWRCPGYLIRRIKQVFPVYIEVDLMTYRASQYDHTCETYIKKELSQRYYALADETMVQRDMYSAFLLYCIAENLWYIDQKLCEACFSSFKERMDYAIEGIRLRPYETANSGIRRTAG